MSFKLVLSVMSISLASWGKEGFETVKNIDYYNKNSKSFYDRTINADLSEPYKVFLKYLPPHASILDAGCGVGRDTKYFLSKGYSVTAFDASEEMVRLATQETGLDVLQLTFQEITFNQEFDGVWANASLLHVPYEETRAIYEKIHKALKPEGLFFACYKYGKDYRNTPDREFWDMDETRALCYLEGLFEVIKIWTEKDTRSKVSPSPDQKWLYFIARKV